MQLSLLRYFLSSVHGESLVTTGCTVTVYGWCPLEFCTLSLLMVVTLVSADVTPPRDVGNGKAGAARDAHVSLLKVTASRLRLGLCLDLEAFCT